MLLQVIQGNSLRYALHYPVMSVDLDTDSDMGKGNQLEVEMEALWSTMEGTTSSD